MYVSSVSIIGSLDWAHICRESSKVLTFIDLAGHEKYLKTTIFGMTGHAPDFCMLMVSHTCILNVNTCVFESNIEFCHIETSTIYCML